MIRLTQTRMKIYYVCSIRPIEKKLFTDEISAAFKSKERNLYSIMLDNISKYTTDQSIISIFKSNGFSLQNGFYKFRPRLFLIHLDVSDYSHPNQIAKLLFSNYTSGNIPVWSRSICSRNYLLDTLKVSYLDSMPVWVVSSTIYDIRTNLVLENVPFEAGGKKKCDYSNITNWCTISGKKCKCCYKEPVDNKKHIRELFDAFVNGALAEEFYVKN